MNTPYDDLAEDEKESDRKEADKFLAVIKQRSDQRPPHSSNIYTTKEKPKVSFPDRGEERHGNICK